MLSPACRGRLAWLLPLAGLRFYKEVNIYVKPCLFTPDTSTSGKPEGKKKVCRAYTQLGRAYTQPGRASQ